MSDSDDKKIEFSTSDVLNALLHRGQNMQHLATQESVDNLRRENEASFTSLKSDINQRFEAMDKEFSQRFESMDKAFNQRFESMDKAFNQRFESVDIRLNKLEGKFDRLQWSIVAATLALLFKEYIFKAVALIQ
ncbi:hypothetical protein [Photorhabdus temperata]|uniref:DUF1640 domain-containing protein n=1 Tax=Photorhabdus temperata J3 TaxID=1389415 RepID=U7QV28_PHOTE|nr:hypothetical protein [Photorhabdus temperata]EQB99167.1 hypothetical protein B738_19576 [Photorhabdus temperata subsp. temperata M1021]ERT10925.1 hypothetical protein O185_22190 [Photorhabdus temperata J3]